MIELIEPGQPSDGSPPYGDTSWWHVAGDCWVHGLQRIRADQREVTRALQGEIERLKKERKIHGLARRAENGLLGNELRQAEAQVDVAIGELEAEASTVHAAVGRQAAQLLAAQQAAVAAQKECTASRDQSGVIQAECLRLKRALEAQTTRADTLASERLSELHARSEVRKEAEVTPPDLTWPCRSMS